jgi:undecaprenyl-diphosphatase
MPWLRGGSRRVSLRDGFHLYTGSFRVPDGVTIVGSAPVATLLALVLACVLVRRRRPTVAVMLLVVFAVGSGIEIVLKRLLTRPHLQMWTDGRLSHLAAFDSSFPSGHAFRVAVLAAMVTTLWPGWRTPAWLVVLTIAVTLALAGFHTPTDVLGGLLLAGALLLAAKALLTSVHSRRMLRGAGSEPR